MSGLPETRVAADYGCFPTWRRAGDGTFVNLSPSELTASADLAAALNRWALAYDVTLDQDDPMNSGFATETEHEFFSAWGRTLAELLAHALDSEVEYFDDLLGAYSIVR